jgi:Domain of unknown function (DUF4328)
MAGRTMSDIDRQLASLQIRGRWARRLLLAVIAVCTSGLSLILLMLLGPDGFRITQLLTALTGLLTVIYLLIALAAAGMVAAWIWRAHSNLRTLGLDGLNYSPGWAVCSFLVPFVNFVVPFQAMRELYNRSIGEEALFAAQSAPDVTSWWPAYLFGWIIPVVLLFLKSIGPATGIHVVTPPTADGLMMLFALVLLATAAFFMQRIIGTVTAAQSAVTGVGDTFA